ncbi:hypothetical protein like AT1G48720 [Hibiscus trionum]|uniref:CCHC-type domain-containing protein n=1 Tax=Hibiscus trionum TaxID=183268 RepID=A0A9W7IU98_HIBTR|nr:hypothetical protein like AT1G48720 [Hibiscus trionum]
MSEDKNFMQPDVPRFDGHYDHWSLLMENLLRSKGYWNLIETGYNEPATGVVLSEAQQKEQVSQALKVTVDDRNRGRGRGRGGYKSRGRGRGRQAFNKATIECYKCHNLGHFQYECPAWGKHANYTELNDHKEMLLMSYVEVNHALCEDIWFFDSGCSNHMSENKTAFCELNETFQKKKVKLGNGTNMCAPGKERVRLNVNGINHVITDVFYVPELKNNLVSIADVTCTDCMVGKQHRDPISKKSTWRAT